MEKTKCKCCGKRIIKYANTKFCSSCATYIRRLHQIIRQYHNKNNQLNYLIYGTKSGTERIRLNSNVSPAIKLAEKRGIQIGMKKVNAKWNSKELSNLIKQATQQTAQDIRKKIEKFEFAKRFKDAKYFGFDNNKINVFIREELLKQIGGGK